MLPKTIFIIFLPLCFSTDADVTFKNVTFRGYSFYTETFKENITSSNSLKEYLPTSVFDEIEFKEQYIPVLRENSLADLTHLDELVIEFCQVTEIQPGALKNVPLLRRLSLKGNRLEEIEEGVFNNLNLSILDLSLNLISRIASGAFDNLPNISEIFLGANKIATWNPSWFKNTPHLTYIFINNNSIGTLPKGAFKNLQGHKSYSGVVNIILSYNQIENIAPGAFNGLERIDHLWLDNNKLKEFDENLLADVEVNDLNLSENKIRCLEGDLDKIVKANYTDLDSNPFDCNCLNKIEDWVKKNGKHGDVKTLFSKLDCLHQSLSELNTSINKFKSL